MFSGEGEKIDPRLYDCALLFRDKDSTWYRCKASVVTGTVGVLSAFFMKCLCRVKVYNVDILHNEMDNIISSNHQSTLKSKNASSLMNTDRKRPPTLLTVANHDCCMDEPLLWGILKFRHLVNHDLMRWVPAAHNICFTNPLYSAFFGLGKSVPVVRDGSGVYQQGMNFLMDRLKEGGKWIHFYPEGKVNMDPRNSIIRFKWGVGRLLWDYYSTYNLDRLTIIPIYHVGMDTVLPEKTFMRFPRLFKAVTVYIGEPINMKDVVLSEITSTDRKTVKNLEAVRSRITSVIQERMREMKIEAEILHAKRTWNS